MRRQMRLSVVNLGHRPPSQLYSWAPARDDDLEPQRLRVGRTTYASGARASQIYGWNFGEEVYCRRLSYIRNTCGDYGELLPW